MLHYRMTWVRSFNPFKIEISVKDLQNILTINQDMALRCFDMVVRLLANKELRRLKGETINNRKHYMDMRFWVSLFSIINVLIYSIYI
jgi:sentrin-specific protease 1